MRSLIDLAPILPKIAKSKYFAQTTLGDEVRVADNLVIDLEVSFDQNLKVKLITITQAKNSGESD